MGKGVKWWRANRERIVAEYEAGKAAKSQARDGSYDGPSARYPVHYRECPSPPISVIKTGFSESGGVEIVEYTLDHQGKLTRASRPTTRKDSLAGMVRPVSGGDV